MLVFAFFNAFDIYDRIAGYLGLSSYAFDEEEAQEKKEEGRSILIQRFKERNLQNNQLEMIQLLWLFFILLMLLALGQADLDQWKESLHSY